MLEKTCVHRSIWMEYWGGGQWCVKNRGDKIVCIVNTWTQETLNIRQRLATFAEHYGSLVSKCFRYTLSSLRSSQSSLSNYYCNIGNKSNQSITLNRRRTTMKTLVEDVLTILDIEKLSRTCDIAHWNIRSDRSVVVRELYFKTHYFTNKYVYMYIK